MFTCCIDLNDVWVRNLSDRTRLKVEALEEGLVINEITGKNFDGNLSTKTFLVGQVHFTHSTFTQTLRKKGSRPMFRHCVFQRCLH